MSNRRAEERRAARRAARKVPAVPGVVADLSDKSKAEALAEAHALLPPVAHTAVQLAFFRPTDGLAMVAHVFGEDARATIAAKLTDVGGPDPHVVFAARRPLELEQLHRADRRAARGHHHHKIPPTEGTAPS